MALLPPSPSQGEGRGEGGRAPPLVATAPHPALSPEGRGSPFPRHPTPRAASSFAVADELDVAPPADRAAVRSALDAHRALPVTGADDQLLVGKPWGDVEIESRGGDGEVPAARILDAA